MWPSSNEPIERSRRRFVTSPKIADAARRSQKRFKDDTKKILLEAVKSQDVFQIREILNSKPELINTKLDEIGSRALHLAADMSNNIVLEVLLELGADISCLDKDGNTALHNAAVSDAVPCIQALLRHGASKKCRNEDSYTPLNLAEHFGSRHAIYELSNH